MNSLHGHIEEINVSGCLSLVFIRLHPEVKVEVIVIETPETASYLKTGNPIKLLFKETEVILGTDEHPAISLQNKITGPVKKIERGTILSKVVLYTVVGEVTAIISTNALEQLALEEGMEVVAMIKLNEIMLSE
ncbi:TOBE domain-containing protein [Rapidithrix thailandica]|uniref:TOBE domain-containing protein n=1 Tax=Rapidithrix thailandica TaxID=413964 RepID=A0AAW9SGK0_9BACT